MLWTLSALAGTWTLSFPNRGTQRVDVEAELAATGESTELFMATWTPGSYYVREYARHVEGLEAVTLDGTRLSVVKDSKNRWRVDTTGVERFTLRYKLFAAALSVRGNFVDQDVAVLNGAPTFIVPADLEGPYTVVVKRPAEWADTVTQLGTGDRFEVESYDYLVDSPIVVGNPVQSAFEVEGVPHVLVDFPKTDWDSQKAAAAVQKVVQAQHDFWGSFPYERYLFLNWVADSGGGGLEHLDSTLMITQRDRTEEDEPFEKWLGLVSHEHFHAWNVKRLRPEALGPFDYQNERYTPDLWVAEGFTSYYDDVLLVRAGLLDEEAYLERMSKNLATLQNTPGRLEQPLSRASFDAWIKHYRPDSNSVNTAVSYYTKGAVVAWLCDASIRTHSKGKRSLDDAMRLAYRRHSGDRGFSSEEFRAAISEVAGVDMSEEIAQWVDTATELDLTEALDRFGLRLALPTDADRATWSGLVLHGSKVGKVLAGSPAYTAGVNAGDEFLAIDAHRVRNPKDLEAVLGRYEPGAKVKLVVSRRGQLLELSAALVKAPVEPELEIDPLNKKGTKRRAGWLRIPTP